MSLDLAKRAQLEETAYQSHRAFHDHLKACKRCRPLEWVYCQKGENLLRVKHIDANTENIARKETVEERRRLLGKVPVDLKDEVKEKLKSIWGSK